MEKQLIKYIIELVGENDILCDELHKYSSEHDYCRDNCVTICEECVIRLMKRRINDGRL